MTTEVLRMNDAARFICVSRRKLYDHIAEGKLPKPLKNGRISLMRVSDLKEFLNGLEVSR